MQRSGELICRDRSALVVIDLQEKLLPAIHRAEHVVWNAGRLAAAAALFDVPRFLTEQYPRGLGPTESALRDALPSPVEKTRFSCGQCDDIIASLRDNGRPQVVLAGIESHVCVLQSALDLSGLGFRVFVVEDATSSRDAAAHESALRRLAAAGVSLVMTESVLFEWCEDASHPQFKALSSLVRQPPPE